MNASDCRNKLAVSSALGTLSGNTSLDYWTDKASKD